MLGVFSTEIADTDFWWHLATGKRILTELALPLPDAFSYTSELGGESYPGEQRVRRFNLTHEWLSQAIWYAVYAIGGFPAVVLWKALLLTFVVGAAAYLGWRRSENLPAAIALALAGVPIMTLFAADRPTIVTFVMAAAYVLLLERFSLWGESRLLWAIPPFQLLWANAHGGFFMGWVVLGAYCLAALKWEAPKRNAVWATAVAAFLVSGLNPNGFRIFEVLLGYRESFLTSTLIEWQRPPLLGPPYTFPVLLFSSALAVALKWREARWQDAALLVAFGGAALTAFRNLALVAFLAPLLLATYVPVKRFAPVVAGRLAVIVLLVGLIGYNGARGRLFQLRVADWKSPAGAADFLAKIDPSKKMFNAYEYGGYLIWRLGPERQTFIDGRALNESVYRDYQTILASVDRGERERLLRDYEVELIVTNTFEFVAGTAYPLALQLANPAETSWELVFEDPQAVIFARNVESNRELIERFRIDKVRFFDQMEAACRIYIEHDPEICNCARTLGFLFVRANQRERARELLELYLANTPFADPQASRSLEELR